jgi:hypothetical protein
MNINRDSLEGMAGFGVCCTKKGAAPDSSGRGCTDLMDIVANGSSHP